MDSRFITTALSGTTTERNTASRSRNESPSTTRMNSGRRAPRYEDRSSKVAVAPPMCTTAPLPDTTGGMTA